MPPIVLLQYYDIRKHLLFYYYKFKSNWLNKLRMRSTSWDSFETIRIKSLFDEYNDGRHDPLIESLDTIKYINGQRLDPIAQISV